MWLDGVIDALESAAGSNESTTGVWLAWAKMRRSDALVGVQIDIWRIDWDANVL